jgi:hypothetical protein
MFDVMFERHQPRYSCTTEQNGTFREMRSSHEINAMRSHIGYERPATNYQRNMNEQLDPSSNNRSDRMPGQVENSIYRPYRGCPSYDSVDRNSHDQTRPDHPNLGNNSRGNPAEGPAEEANNQSNYGEEIANLKGMFHNISTSLTEQLQKLSSKIDETTKSKADLKSQKETVQAPILLKRTKAAHRLKKHDASSSTESTDSEEHILSSSSTMDIPNRRIRSGRQHHRHNVKLPVFNGREQWKIWFNRFQEVANRQGWSEDERLDELLPRLQGAPGEFVYDQLPSRVRRDYNSLVKELDSRYRVVETSKTFAAKLSHRGQKPGETIEEYAAELKHLYDKAYPNRDPETRQEDLLRKFLDGLLDDRARFHVEYVKEPETIDEAIYQVVNFLETKRRVPNMHQDQYSDKRFNRKPTRLVRPAESDEEDETDTEGDGNQEEEEQANIVARIPEKQRSNYQTKGKFQTKYTQAMPNSVADKPSTSGSSKVNQSNQELENQVKELTEKLQKLEGQLSSNRKDNWYNKPYSANRQCYRCQKDGHFIRDCPYPPNYQSDSSSYRLNNQVPSRLPQVPSQYQSQPQGYTAESKPATANYPVTSLSN